METPDPFGKVAGALRNLRARHSERHQATGHTFAIADRIAYLDAAAWDGITAGASVFLSRAYLDALEKSGPRNAQARYSLIFRDGRPVAALAAQLIDVSPLQLKALA